MKLPRDLSGDELVRVLCRNWGYRIVHQQGSHIVLETEQPSHQRLAVPAHKSLRVGTLSAILRAVGAHKGIERTELLRFL
jgi:predicted RNA binding protein YcfA (HicA-like mRNA interferase family)